MSRRNKQVLLAGWATVLLTAGSGIYSNLSSADEPQTVGHWFGKPGYSWQWVEFPKEEAEFAVFDTDEAREELKDEAEEAAIKPETPPYYRPGLPLRP